jgi:hypothetical protein
MLDNFVNANLTISFDCATFNLIFFLNYYFVKLLLLHKDK